MRSSAHPPSPPNSTASPPSSPPGHTPFEYRWAALKLRKGARLFRRRSEILRRVRTPPPPAPLRHPPRNDRLRPGRLSALQRAQTAPLRRRGPQPPQPHLTALRPRSTPARLGTLRHQPPDRVHPPPGHEVHQLDRIPLRLPEPPDRQTPAQPQLPPSGRRLKSMKPNGSNPTLTCWTNP